MQPIYEKMLAVALVQTRNPGSLAISACGNCSAHSGTFGMAALDARVKLNVKVYRNLCEKALKIRSLQMGTRFLLSVVACALCACGSDEVAINCQQEATLIALHHADDAGEPRTMRYRIDYSGDRELTGVTWEYGDGITELILGRETMHQYRISGTYTVKATVGLRNGTFSCTVKQQESVVVD